MAATAEYVDYIGDSTADFAEWEADLAVDQIIDFHEWEAELNTNDTHARAPESEIYGRSLSTIYRLGAFMVEHAMTEEVVTSPEAAQAKREFITSVAEGFGTDMELGGGLEVRDFDARPVIDGKVMADDLKTPVSSMIAAGLKNAAEKVKTEALKDDFRFVPQFIRSKWDYSNARIVDKMTQGKTAYNTRIVISPFPEEAAAKSGNAYWRHIGYVPHLRRGFLQLYHFDGEHEVLAGSLSFDGSNIQRLREVFARRGKAIPENEITDNWLKYAITGNLSAEEAKALATEIADEAADPAYKKSTNTVDVTERYEGIMERVFNETYVHICESLARGRQTEDAHKLIRQLADQAHHFNDRYSKALYKMRADKSQFTDDDSIVLHELLVYSTIEMMRGLYLKEKDNENSRINKYDDSAYTATYLQSLDSATFQNALGNAGADGARQNHGYSACGIEINLGEGGEGPDNPQSVFGGTTKRDHDSLGSRTFRCKNGHLNHRPFEDTIEQCWVPGCKDSVACKPKENKPKDKKDIKKELKEEVAEARPELAAEAESAFDELDIPAIETEEKRRRQTKQVGKHALQQSEPVEEAS